MNREKSVAIVALVTAGVVALWVFIFKKVLKPSGEFTPSDTPDLPDYTGGLPDTRAPTSKDIEQRAALVMEKPSDVWDRIDRYTQERDAEAATRTVYKTPPPQTTREESLTEAKSHVPEPEIANVVNQACPVVVWEVEFFNKDTRVWDKRYVKAVTSTEAIKAVEPTVNGGLFSADKTA